MSDRAQHGFSLLEAIVALTILASSGIALFSWFSSSFDGLIQLEAVQEKQQLMEDLDAYFATLNIQQETVQTMRVNGFDVRWEATLVEPIQQGRAPTGSLSNFDLGLYDVAIEVTQGKLAIGEYSLRLVGFSKVRDVDNAGS